MTRILRIVAKDIRHLKLEILLSLALTAAFAATVHLGWPRYDNDTDPFRQTDAVRMFMDFLMPLGWWVILTRNVQDESLVGDRQFWITRPYGWPRLLMAKLIFALLFICLPLFLAQSFLLHQAGLHPSVVLPGLFDMQWGLFCLLLLPALALSTVTPSLTRGFLLVLALGVYAALVAYLENAAYGGNPGWMPGDIVTSTHRVMIFVWFMPAVCAIVVLLQYARRRTTLSLTLLAGLILFLTIGLVWHTPVHKDPPLYPRLSAGETSPLQVALDSDPTLQAPTPAIDNGRFTSISVPLLYSGIAPGHAIEIEGKRIVLEIDGRPVQRTGEDLVETPETLGYVGNGWQGGSSSYFNTSSPVDERILLSRGIFTEANAKTLTIHLFLAVNDYAADSPVSVTATGDNLDSPRHGRCLIRRKDSDSKGDAMLCRYPFTAPPPTLMSWKLQQHCGVSSPSDRTQQQWMGNQPSGGSFGEFSPVQFLWTAFPTTWQHKDDPAFTWCPNTPITFTPYHLVRRRLIDIKLPPIDPRRYIPAAGKP